MERMTIDFGIDLGTTNSTVAVIEDTAAQVIPNKGGAGITPSAVWIDKRGSLHVGFEAKQRALVDDPDNGDFEFKLRMGLGADGRKVFARSGHTMLPEELSAEVLKSLKMDVQTNLGEQIQAAVICVPAAFELPQTNATQTAAQLAGFARCPLLLEPVAASLAYGFQTESENVYWLVYDFGGGTFDAALMRVRDGLIQVVNHDGDNHLGGKLIDWDIVTKKLIPVVTRQFNLPDFRRGNPQWRAALGKMKYYAEEAKIEVCRTQAPHEIWIEGLCTDAAGKTVDLAYTLTPADVEEVGRPYIERSLGLCRKTLKDKGLAGAHLERILMVGGTSLNPWLRDAVQTALGSKLEFGIDPVTVVARGAAIFASTQPMPETGQPAVLPPGAWRLQVEHEPVGNAPDPDIGGRVLPPEGQDPTGGTIEFIDTKTQWRSGRITLGAEGVFLTQLFAEEKRRCEYRIELCDATGTQIPTAPDRVVYTLGIVPDKPPASNTIGIGLANDQMSPYIKKGTKLPARGTHDHRTTLTLHAGQAEEVLRIPVLEGENARATRNHGIGELVIKGSDIRRDLAASSQVEMTVLMDESQRIRVQAFLPTLDEDFEVSFDLKMQRSSVAALSREIKQQKDRLTGARAQAQEARSLKAEAAVARLEEEQLVSQVDALLDAATQDPDALAQLDRRVRDLTAAVDEMEDALAWPALLEKVETYRREVAELVHHHGGTSDKNRLQAIERDVQQAVDAGDVDLLQHGSAELLGLYHQVADSLISYHLAGFNYLVTRMPSMRDPKQAEQLIAQARRAINREDCESLRAANRQLVALLPHDEQAKADRRIGNVI